MAGKKMKTISLSAEQKDSFEKRRLEKEKKRESEK